MNAPDHERVSSLFLQIVDMKPEDRRAFLERACGDDRELRRHVESLLAHDGQFPSGLDTGAMLRRAEESLQVAPGRIGAYQIEEQLGEGGMGVVYRARQEQPIRREVAVKLIKRGLETAQVLKRFDSERRVLALMDHPGVARVLDSGTTDQGRPYFAMEYVRGEPITRFCDTQRLDVTERLKLFLRVCEAVEHAHQNAIIHRDLKPSNVLVTRVSGQPAPKIIDFGIAKALTPDHGVNTLTEIGQFVGTPEYMSPEQASQVTGAVDTRTDVYSLGAILYELLAGYSPFDRRLLGEVGTDEMRRRVLAEDPPPPSARVAHLGGGADPVAAVRRMRPATLERRLRGDLDCIVMKSLEKKRVIRYGSVAALAAELRRHLHDEPIEARPKGGLYRLGKLIRKHRTVAAAITVLVPLLVGFLVTMAVQAERVATERDRAEEISDFLVRFYDVPFHVVERHGIPTAEEVLLSSVARIGQLHDRPRLQARLNHQMGRVLAAVGNADTALPLLESAHAELIEQAGRDSPRTLSAMHDLAMVHWLRRDPGAELFLEEALGARRRVLGDRHPDTLRAMIDIGHMHKRALRHEQALPWFELAAEGTQAIYGEEHPESKTAAALLASAHLDLHRYDEAAALEERLIPNFEGSNPEVYIALYNLACARAGQGRADEALAMLQRAVDRGFWSGIRADRCWTEYLDDPEFIRLAKLSELRYEAVRDQVERMADHYRREGRLREAAELYETVLDQVPLGPADRTRWELLLAAVYLDSGRYEEAEPLVLGRIDTLRGDFGSLIPLANTLWFLTQARLGQGDLDGALEALDEQEAIYDTLNVKAPYNIAIRAALRGDDRRALEELHEVKRLGFADTDKLQRELAFAPLRGSAEFDALVREVRNRNWVPSDLTLDIWFRLGVMPAVSEEQAAYPTRQRTRSRRERAGLPGVATSYQGHQP